ncbi:serine-rich protein-related [Euphorbia peplus]|nr:serine-rich protein-related [Euphorbia peplus]
MCNEVAPQPLITRKGLVDERTWLLLQALQRANTLATPSPPPTTTTTTPAAANTGGGGVTKMYCICSPTTHPGSFRCRYHIAEYNFVCKAPAS